MSESKNSKPQSLSLDLDPRLVTAPTPEDLESKLVVDYHLTREEIWVIAEAYKLRRKALFLATRKELQDFINQDYRAANEEALGWPKGVKILQEALEIKSDGRFGPATFRKLIDFQKQKGLKPDGVAGPRTIAELNIADKINGTVKPVPTDKPLPVDEPEIVQSVTLPKPSATKIIDRFEARAKAIQENMNQLRNARDENTGFTNVLMDDARSVFGAETGKATYEKAWEAIRSETRTSLNTLKSEITASEMSDTERKRFDTLGKSYTQILQQELGGPEVLASMVASVKSLPNTATSVAYGVVWMGKWAVELVTSIFDITIFLAKMVLPKHRKAVGEQWDKLVEMSNASGGVTNLMADAFQSEVARVQSLPANQQSEAMGKITGNVLGMIGLGAGASKLAKIGAELMAKSSAAKAAQVTAETAAKAADTAAKVAKQKALAAQYMANISNVPAATVSSTTTAAQEAVVKAAEAAKHAAEAAKLGWEAAVAKAQAFSAKAGSVILHGPAEALMSNTTSLAFNKVILLVQTKKAPPRLLQEAVIKAFADHKEQKRLATAAGDTVKLERLAKEEKFLDKVQEKLNQIPTLLDTNITLPKKTAKPDVITPKTDVKDIPADIKPETPPKPRSKKASDSPIQPEGKTKTEKVTQPKKENVAVEPPIVEVPKPKAAPEKIPKTPKRDAAAAEAPLHFPTEFIYDTGATLVSNIRKFRKVFNPDRAGASGLLAAEYQKIELWIASFNRVNDTMKQAKNSGNVVALERATQDVEAFLRNPEAWVQRVQAGQYESAPTPNRESKSSTPDAFLKNMFNRYYDELVEKFSPIQEIAGSPKHIEQLLASDVLTLLKEAMDSGRISANEALTNIHSLRTEHKKFIESSLRTPFATAMARRTDAWNRAQEAIAHARNGSRNGR